MQIPDNSHRYIYGALAALLAVCAAIQTGILVPPPGLVGVQFWAAALAVFLAAFLPSFVDNIPPKR